MSGSNVVGAKAGGIVDKLLELDFAVTQNVRIGCAPALVFTQKVLKYVVPVLGGKVCRMQF